MAKAKGLSVSPAFPLIWSLSYNERSRWLARIDVRPHTHANCAALSGRQFLDIIFSVSHDRLIKVLVPIVPTLAKGCHQDEGVLLHYHSHIQADTDTAFSAIFRMAAVQSAVQSAVQCSAVSSIIPLGSAVSSAVQCSQQCSAVSSAVQSSAVQFREQCSAVQCSQQCSVVQRSQQCSVVQSAVSRAVQCSAVQSAVSSRWAVQSAVQCSQQCSAVSSAVQCSAVQSAVQCCAVL
jgi:hypothetical protein